MLVEQRQSDQFRKNYVVTVSDEPAGLPVDYDLLLYSRSYRLRVTVRGQSATGDLVTDSGMFRGAMSFGLVDQLSRDLAYGLAAKQMLRCADAGLTITEGSLRNVSHNRRAWS